ncbi:MAG: hypothetical protein ACMG6S_30280 [Byssovorax sp.]
MSSDARPRRRQRRSGAATSLDNCKVGFSAATLERLDLLEIELTNVLGYKPSRAMLIRAAVAFWLPGAESRPESVSEAVHAAHRKTGPKASR